MLNHNILVGCKSVAVALAAFGLAAASALAAPVKNIVSFTARGSMVQGGDRSTTSSFEMATT